MEVRFGECTLDTDARRLVRNGTDIHLSPKAFELLKLLVESRPRAFAKSELLDRVWPGVFVSDASLARVVNEVRAAIGDSARKPHLLRTVHAFGYAFSGEASPAIPGSPHPQCWFIEGDTRLPLADGEQLIGRDADLPIALDSPRVSRRHARVVVSGTTAMIEDLGSKNGTFLAGERVTRRTELRAGDVVRIGPFSLVFAVATGGSSTETEVTS